MQAVTNMTRRRAIVAIATGCTIVAAAGAGTAQAASFVPKTVPCGFESHVVAGGGMQVVGEGTKNFRTQIQETTPGTIGGGVQSLWLVRARNNDTVAHKLGFFAICHRPPPGYQVVKREFVVPAGGFLRDTATCPKGKVVIGGGAAVVGEGSGNFRTSIQETAPGTIGGGAQSLWLVAMRNNDKRRHRIAISAVCADKLEGYSVVRKDSTLSAGGFVRSAAQCPKGMVVYAGGVSVIGEGTRNFRTRVQETAPGTVGASNETSVWLNAVSNADTKAHKIGMHAVCAAPFAGYEVYQQNVNAS